MNWLALLYFGCFLCAAHAAYTAFRRRLDSADQVGVGFMLSGYALLILLQVAKEVVGK
jgi:hypothetical protein